MSKILVCGDSYCVTDPDYLGLHWTEKISSMGHTVDNLAHGGTSNALIALQLFHGIQFNPDCVILSFTSEGRYEFDDNLTAQISEFTVEELAHYQKIRYTTSSYREKNKDRIEKYLNPWTKHACSDNFEKLKNYFYILLCLNTLKLKNIPFCFSLGGFEYKHNYKQLVESNFLTNELAVYAEQELGINLWNYGHKTRPYFHVDDEQIQQRFADECIDKLRTIGW